MGNKLRLLLVDSLTLAVGTSSVERVFNVLSHVRTKDRNLIQHELTDAEVRMRLNGPKLEDLPVTDLAEEYIASGRVRADDPIFPKKPKPVRQTPEMNPSQMTGRSSLFSKKKNKQK